MDITTRADNPISQIASLIEGETPKKPEAQPEIEAESLETATEDTPDEIVTGKQFD